METYETILNNARLVVKNIFAKIQEYPHFEEIQNRMQEAQKNIGHTFSDISYLAVAFCRTKIVTTADGDNNKTYQNDALAQLGDAVLKLVITANAFSQEKDKKQIQEAMGAWATNENLCKTRAKLDLSQYAYHETHFYNNAPAENQVSVGKHDALIESVIGAIYLDSDFSSVTDWIHKYVYKA